jgi:succinate dehydrogenase hydrophobic anchor subunit
MTAPAPQDFTEASRWRRRPRPTFAWTAQVVTGVLLLVLLTMHMIAQHFLVPGGLRGYAQVVAWLRNPVVFTLEALLLVAVSWHAMAGVHAIMLDLGLRGRTERIVAAVLGYVMVATILYGLWLLYMIALRSPHP